MHKLYAITIITTILSTNIASSNDTIYLAKSFYKNRVLEEKEKRGFKIPKDIKNINKKNKQRNKKTNNKENRYANDVLA